MINEEQDMLWICENLISKDLHNKSSLAKALGISRPTLNSRLTGKTEWKTLEVQAILDMKSRLMPKLKKKQRRYHDLY